MLAFAGRFVVTGHKPAQEARCASVMKYSAVSGPLSEMITKATLGPIPGFVISRSGWRPWTCPRSSGRARPCALRVAALAPSS